MKKIILVSVVVAMAWASVVPDAQAAPLLQEAMIGLLCSTYSGYGAWMYDCTTQEETEPQEVFHASGTLTRPSPGQPAPWNLTGVVVDCEPYPTCKNDVEIYYVVTLSLSWSQASWEQFGTSVTLRSDVAGSELDRKTVSCGSGMSGSCTLEMSGIVPPATTSTPILDAWVMWTWLDDPDSSQNITLTYDIQLSAQPISDCDQELIVLTEDTYEIDPTIEIPKGPDAVAPDAPDDQIYPTMFDQYYRLYTYGTFNDGAAVSGDTAISWDGETWTPLSEIPPSCQYQIELNGEVVNAYILRAESETFHIRANDTPGNFANNTSGSPPLTYAIGLGVRTGLSCEAQYTYDNFEDVVGFTGVASTDEDGVIANNADIPLVVGEWYVLRWDYGYWQDDGGPDQIALEYWDNAANNWYDLAEGSRLVWCISTDGLQVLFQAEAEEFVIRVNNVTGTFALNTGTPYYTLYHAAFTRTPDGCEQTFEIGELIEHRIVDADKASGEVFASMVGGSTIHLSDGLKPGAWYVLDTTGGPWWEIAMRPHYRYDMAVSEDNGDTWDQLENWNTPSCNVALDALGHRRVIFQMPESGEEFWKLRVDGTAQFVFNTGEMEWDLYGAVKLQNTLPDGSCDYSYDLETVVDMGEIAGNDSDGEALTGLVSGQLYAIRIIGEGLGWQEQLLGTTLYDTQISHNDGTQWSSLPYDYPPALCHDAVGNDLWVFVRPGDNYQYRLRVDSTTFDNNTGSMGYTVYPAEAGQTIKNTCLDGWSLQSINGFDWLDVRDESGEILSSDTARYEELIALVPGRSYLVETPAGEGPWGSFDALNVQRWDTALSPDNGQHWEAISRDSVFVDCVDYNPFGHVWRAKFTAQEGDVWKIRVNDDAGAFDNNTGNMAYKFYALCQGMACTGSLPNDSTTNGIPAITIQASTIKGGGDVCTIAVMRPGPLSLGEIANLGNYLASWVQYLNLSTLRYMAWCPRHTSMLSSVLSVLRRREPLATVYEWVGKLRRVRAEIESYDWGENGQQAESIYDMATSGEFRTKVIDRIFVKDSSPVSIWEGGRVVDFSDTSLPPAYASCQNSFTKVLPSRLRTGVCFVSAYFIETSASFWIQMLIDISAFFLLLRVMKTTLQEVIYMMTGVKPWTANAKDVYPYIRGEKSLTARHQEKRDDAAIELEARFGRKFRRNNDGTYS